MKRLYAIFDSKATSILGGVHVFNHDAPAVRFFGDIAADPQNMVGRHTADYSLLCLGEIDEVTSVIRPYEPVQVVITGQAWKASQQPEGNQA